MASESIKQLSPGGGTLQKCVEMGKIVCNFAQNCRQFCAKLIKNTEDTHHQFQCSV